MRLIAFAAFAVATTAASGVFAQTPPAQKSHASDAGFVLYVGDQVIFDLSDPSAAKVVAVSSAAQNSSIDNKPAKGTVRFALTTQPSPQGQAMMLRAVSGVNYAVRYHARLFGFRRDGTQGTAATSTCPIGANIAAVELWPSVSTGLIIGDFSKTTAGDGDCKE